MTLIIRLVHDRRLTTKMIILDRKWPRLRMKSWCGSA